MYYNQKFKNRNSGIALVAVLAILVVLAVMAATFVTLMNIESKQSSVQLNSQHLDMLINSGLEQAKAIISVDKFDNNDSYSKWMTVKDSDGKISGRYRIRIEDEAAKVNINKAYLLKKSKGTGWDTGEINLPQALSVSSKASRKIIKYRYGKNNLPGVRGDDDQNNLILMADKIDNDADGLIDENDEGINDPKEYNAKHLNGDDRKFSSMTELINIILPDFKKNSPALRSKLMTEIPRAATIYSIDKPGSITLPNDIPSDINSITPRECRKLLIKANADLPFEPNSAKQMQLAANIIDYRDENHVLSTLGSTYGVEAVCFNEVLANDASYSINPELGALPGGDPGVHYIGEDPWDKRWKLRYGSVDGKRLIYRVDLPYDCVTDDPMAPSSEYYYNLDPRKGWRILKDGSKKIGDLNINGRKIKFGKYPGEFGYKLSIEPYPYTKGANYIPPEDLPGHKRWRKWPRKNANVIVFGSKKDYEKSYTDTLKVLRKIGRANGTKPDFPKGYFKNSLAMIYGWMKDPKANPKAIGCYKIIDGDEESITFNEKEEYSGKKFKDMLKSAGFSNNYYDLSVTINSWGNRSPFAMVPKANVTYLMRAREPKAGVYYQIVIGRPPQGRWVSKTSYPNKLGVSGEVGGEYTEDKKNLTRRWLYKEGKPIKTKQGGWIDIMLTSDPAIDRNSKNRQWIGYFRMVAPEVSEMYNASATPVSLANWRVICNTGSLATQIGRIRRTAYYDKKLKRRIVDDNPVVQPRGHFYLVNNTELFDSWYGNADNKWGSSADEQVPVFQMDEENWGVAYKIKSAKYVLPHSEGGKSRAGVSIMLEDQNLDKETFNLETVKFIDKEHEEDIHSWNNIFAPVISEDIRTEGEIFIAPIGNSIKEIVGKSVMVLGLPHSGGIVSLTLKNEYDQVCARTVDYGKVDIDELGASTEKIDPTKNIWVKRKVNSIGGTENKAENKSMRSHHNDKFFIKNGPFCSIGSLKNISTGNNFERLGGNKNVSKGINALTSLSKYMCSSYVRLEACLGDVTRIGWNAAYDEVAHSSLSSIQAKNGKWQVNKWAGNTLRFLTGPLRGEKFPIISNSKSTLLFAKKDSKFIPRSAPNRKALKPNVGDKFSIGPGYATPMCYTRKSGESAVFEWKNAIAYPGTYNLYIYGLNDAIDTTEFLEENNNASIDVKVWNYKTKQFDMLKKRGQYGKQDSFNADKIKPENISRDGNIKIQLTAHNVVERNTDDKTGKALVGTGGKQTGIAWFNYAIITPVPVPGRVNANTAPPRLLASLPGIESKLANNIYEGIDANGKKKLKPYKSLGDLFKVKGMTPNIFEKCANILVLDSSVFTVEVEAQILKRTGGERRLFQRPKSENVSVDNVIASRKKRFVIEAEEKQDDYINIIEKENYFVR